MRRAVCHAHLMSGAELESDELSEASCAECEFRRWRTSKFGSRSSRAARSWRRMSTATMRFREALISVWSWKGAGEGRKRPTPHVLRTRGSPIKIEKEVATLQTLLLALRSALLERYFDCYPKNSHISQTRGFNVHPTRILIQNDMRTKGIPTRVV